MATNLKSIRVDEALIAELGLDANFSSVVNQALKEYLNRSAWLPNFQIQEYAGISPAELMERVKTVQYLRQSDSAIVFTFCPTSEDEIKRNKHIYDYANGDFNALHDQYIYFNVEFPVDFLLFLKSKTWEQVEKFVHGFLCFLQWSDEGTWQIIEEQLERKTLKSVVEVGKTQTFQRLKTQWKTYNKAGGGAKLRCQFSDIYFRTMIELGIDPLLFPYVKPILRTLHYPFHLPDKVFSKASEFTVKLTAAYMRDVYEEQDDWRLIVVNGIKKNDNLQRAESSEIPWKSWLEGYSFLHYSEISHSITSRSRKKAVKKASKTASQ